MAIVPKTSETLLIDLASSPQHARWGQFVARYRPMMEAYLAERFPSVEAEDVIQETLVAMMRILPAYHYAPNEKGAFHNYLTGVLRKKALKSLDAADKRRLLCEDLGKTERLQDLAEDSIEREWRASACEIALQQYLSDDSVSGKSREVFRRIAVNGEKPEAVAVALGMKRNAVDQIKRRGVARIREILCDLRGMADA